MSLQSLRNAHRLARFVLVWFALFIGVAIATSIVKPQALHLICSGTGVIKLLPSNGGDPAQTSAHHTLDCPFCPGNSAPPPAAVHLVTQTIQMPTGVRQSTPATHIAPTTAAPLPARGPPVLS
jgi:hypothetical protein